VAREIVYHGRKIQAGFDAVSLPDGTEIRRDVVVHPGAVAVLPLVDDAHVCLVENERAVTGETLWEVPAGTLEPGESPERAAARELAEETGYRAAAWRKLASFYPSPGVLSERMHLFLAATLTPGPAALEPGERLRPQIFAWTDAVAMATDGRIRDAKTLVAVLLWERLRPTR
jgi:ADP-ribose pyrophosphatase